MQSIYKKIKSQFFFCHAPGVSWCNGCITQWSAHPSSCNVNIRIRQCRSYRSDCGPCQPDSSSINPSHFFRETLTVLSRWVRESIQENPSTSVACSSHGNSNHHHNICIQWSAGYITLIFLYMGVLLQKTNKSFKTRMIRKNLMMRVTEIRSLYKWIISLCFHNHRKGIPSLLLSKNHNILHR